MKYSVIFNNSNAGVTLVGQSGNELTFLTFDEVSALTRHLVKNLIIVPANRIFTGYGSWKEKQMFQN